MTVYFVRIVTTDFMVSWYSIFLAVQLVKKFTEVRNPKVDHRVSKTRQLNCVLNRFNPVHIFRT